MTDEVICNPRMNIYLEPIKYSNLSRFKYFYYDNNKSSSEQTLQQSMPDIPMLYTPESASATSKTSKYGFSAQKCVGKSAQTPCRSRGPIFKKGVPHYLKYFFLNPGFKCNE